MKKLIVFLHTSLDGFVAGENGEMDWIGFDEQLAEYAGRLTDQAGTALYGRNTYGLMDGYWPTAGDQPNASAHDVKHSQWYNQVDKVVLSTSLKNSDQPKTKIIGENLVEQIGQLKQEPGRDIVVFGSPTAVHSLMQHNLIDEYWLFVNPILLGTGIPLFENISERVPLQLVESNTLASGVIALRYVS